MSLGDRIEFYKGSYEVRGEVDGRYVVRIRNREKNSEKYLVWTKDERAAFDRKNDHKSENSERNQQIYERHLAGETYADLGRDFALSSGRVRDICAAERRKELRSTN